MKGEIQYRESGQLCLCVCVCVCVCLCLLVCGRQTTGPQLVLDNERVECLKACAHTLAHSQSHLVDTNLERSKERANEQTMTWKPEQPVALGEQM